MTRTKLDALVIGAVVGVAVVCGAVLSTDRARAQQVARPVGEDQAGAVLREKAAARVRAAERVVDELQAELDTGNTPLTEWFIEHDATARRRLAEARIDASADSKEHVRAVEQYLLQCRARLELLRNRKGQDPIKTGLRLAEYHIADAEYWLEKVKAGR